MNHKKFPVLLLLALCSILAVAGLLAMLSPVTAVASPNTPTADFPVIADFEGGLPAGWFVYGDWGGGVTVDTAVPTISDTNPLALPGQVGNNDILSVTANVPSWAGFGAALTQDWSDYDAISFWYYGENLSTTHEFEIQTVPGDDRRATFVDDFNGWQQIILPFSTFGAGGAYDVSQVDNWVFVLDGTVGSFKLDNLELVNLVTFADFEGGVPAGWFVYGDWGGGVTVDTAVPTISDTNPLALPGQVGNNDILSVTANVPSWAGFGAALTQDWSDMQGVSFWYYGQNLSTTHEFEIQTVPGDDRRTTFVDNFNGWRLISLPFTTFGATPYDVSQVDNWVFVLDGTIGSFKIDHLNTYGDAGNITLKAQFDASDNPVTEGDTVTLTVSLNITSSNTVSVDYATSDGTATNSDYAPMSGTLTFDPGETSASILINTIDDSEEEDDETFTVQLSNPVSVTLGAIDVTTVTIIDNEVATGGKADIIDDFEDGQLPSGTDGDGLGIGFVTWGDFWNGTTVEITTTTAVSAGIADVPGSSSDNIILELSSNVVGWGGLTHAFENAGIDTWTPMDWSSYEGFTFWYYGTGSGTTILAEINENRNPGSTTADTEIWSYSFDDNTAGWQLIEVLFTDLVRKEIGNGAPNDGWTGEEVHGWAVGTLPTGGSEKRYVDDFGLLQRVTVVDDFEDGQLPSGIDGDGLGIGFITWGDFWNGTTVEITTTTAVSAGIADLPGSSSDNIVIELTSNVIGWGGFTHAFENETVDTWTPMDWSTYEGFCFWYYGTGSGTTILVELNENRNPGSTTADTEIWNHTFDDNTPGWQFIQVPFADLTRKEIGNGAPNDGWTGEEVHGWALGTLGTSGNSEKRYADNFSVYGQTGVDPVAKVQFTAADYGVMEGETAVLTATLNVTSTSPVTVSYHTGEGYAISNRDYVAVSGTIVIPAGSLSQAIMVDTIEEAKADGDKTLMVYISDPVNAELGFAHRAVLEIIDNDPVDPALIHDFEGFHSFAITGNVQLETIEIMSGDALAVPGQGTYEQVLSGTYDATSDPAQITQTFVQGQDWSSYEGMSFWYYGTNSGNTITVELLENQMTTTADLPATSWEMVWHDEFDGAAGTAPDHNIWQHEIGDGALNDLVGWGNSESQYYTDSTDNAALDGAGNLAITMHKVNTATTDLSCWYGPCEYTSARLISADRMEYEYGRMEARVQVPTGGDGLWPAFWMLGNDIGEVGWPQSGEIDIMEYVSRIPTEIFGTIHGPGYSGGAAYGNTYDFGVPVSQTAHIFTIEWSPNQIDWYVDGIHYHSAEPADVAPNEWVYNHAFYLIMNLAIGGNFGGTIDPDIPFPQTMAVDYVRVYQGVNISERFENSFVDDFTGWQKIVLPFDEFTRSTMQPVGAPDDGLTLSEVWGYGFHFADGSSGSFRLDRVYLETVTSYTLYMPLVAKQP